VPLYTEAGRWILHPGFHMRPVNLTLDEAMALYMASRLAQHHADERNHPLEHAFEKLAQALPPSISSHVLASVEMMQSRPLNLAFSDAMKAITRGWAEHRSVRIWYARSAAAEPQPRLLDPYLIEPSAAGHATYVIGRDHNSGEVRTFKIERIRAVESTSASFTIPADFAAARYLSHRWGIGYGDETEVRLRFSPTVASRVRESHWHPSQQLSSRPDGGLEMTLRVAGTLEITPWILSWGPEVVVLAPADLRATVAGMAHSLAERYDAEPPIAAGAS
jgi:predicted DNA-binding transcriptional regulator YafY